MSHKYPIQMSTLEEMEGQRLAIASEMQQVCTDYGLYANVIVYRPSPIPNSGRNRLYLVASRDPNLVCGLVPFNPEEYLRRNARTDRLIYTDVFVYDMAEDNNRMDAMEKLIEYCRNTEFLTSMYSRFNLPPPKKLRRFELRQLMEARDQQRNEPVGPLWRQATDALNDFFRKERKTGLTRKWLDFFRSDKFPDDGTPLEKLRAFRRRHNPEISLEQLMACNGNIHTLEMQEHEYRRFAEFMQNTYPDVPYAVSKKIHIDNGVISVPAELERTYGTRVTGEEYNRVLERTFAQDGGAAVAGLRPSSFVVRKISYTAVDEPYIASAFHDAALRYAHRDDLRTIKGRGGELQLYSIPKDDLMSFVSLAKANDLPFYLDNLGKFEIPSLDFIHAIVSSRDEAKTHCILTRIVNEKADQYHLVPEEERPMLQDIILQASECNNIKENNRKEAKTHECKKDHPHNL